MKLKSALIISLLFLTFFCFGQFKDYNNTVGFICGSTGSSTRIVKKFYQKIENKNYNAIKAMLYSKNAAKNFLAVILCEKLREKSKIKLKDKDLKKIAELYQSERTVEICGGCTFIKFVKLSVLLKNEDENKTRDDAEEWMKDMSIQ